MESKLGHSTLTHLNTPALKMHSDSVQLRCVIKEHASGKTTYMTVPDVISGGNGIGIEVGTFNTHALKYASLEDAPRLSAVKMRDLGSMHQGR